ncbi:MAG TPA: alpha/beta fold hydrolase [Streptosporangiaceae bacterium]|nr:alpha/beta fold hydrolase [Streptosporangiaceae bacterium]
MTDPIAPWPGELVSVGSGEVFVRAAPAAGDAEPALFVHGLGGSALNWTDLMDLLRTPPADRPDEPALACEAMDLPGFGFSPPAAGGQYTIDAMAEAVATLIDRRGHWPVHLAGNSMGGAVCVRLAARRPDLVRTLTLISPALPDLRPRVLPLRLMLLCAPGIGPWMLNGVKGWMTPEARSAGSVAEVYADVRLMHRKRRAEEVAELVRRDGLGYADDVLLAAGRALISEYLSAGPRSLWRDAARVTAPTLVIYGSHDRLVRPAMAGRAARAFRGARVVVLPRTGHVAMMERPGLVASQMRDLFGAARRPAPEVAR